MIWEMGVLMIGIACLVIAGALIPTLIELRKTARESSRAVEIVNTELGPLLKEMRTATGEFSQFMDQAQSSVEHASMLFHAIGDLGDRLQRAQEHVGGFWQRVQEALLPGKSNALVHWLTVGSGLAAAGTFIKQRLHHATERSQTNGQRC